MSRSRNPISASPTLPLSAVGGWFAFVQAASVLFAIVGYFVWPHVFSDHSVRMILEGIQRSPLEYFMRLDPIVLFGTLLQLPVWLGLWAALRSAHPALSTLAVVSGILSTVAILPVRPLIELFALASKYALADAPDQAFAYTIVGETLMAQFHGTSWAASIMCGGLSAVLFAMAMRRSNIFGGLTISAMFISGLGSLLVLIPVFGLVSLFVFGTVIGILGTILCGIDLLRDSTEMGARR